MGFGSTVKGFFLLVWRLLDGIRKGLSLILLLLLFGFLLAALHTSVPVVPRSAALVIDPQGELVEQLAADPGAPRDRAGLRRPRARNAAARCDRRDRRGQGRRAQSSSSCSMSANSRRRGSRSSKKSVRRSVSFAPPASASSSRPTRSTRLSSIWPRKRARFTWIRSGSSMSTGSATTACSSRTRSTSSASTSTCSARGPSRVSPTSIRAATWRRVSARRPPPGSTCYGMPTSPTSRALARSRRMRSMITSRRAPRRSRRCTEIPRSSRCNAAWSRV